MNSVILIASTSRAGLGSSKISFRQELWFYFMVVSLISGIQSMAEGADYLLSQEALVQFKQLLKDARISQGATFESLSQQTKIPKGHLAALEEGRFEDLPPRVFVKGFLKNLSKELKIEESMLIKVFNLANPELNKTFQFDARKAITPPKKGFIRSIAIPSAVDNLLLSIRINVSVFVRKLQFYMSAVTQQKIRMVLLALLLIVVSIPSARYLAARWSALPTTQVNESNQSLSKTEINSQSALEISNNSQTVDQQPDLEPSLDGVYRDSTTTHTPSLTQEAALAVASGSTPTDVLAAAAENPMTSLPKTTSPEIQTLKLKVVAPVELQVSIDGKRSISGLQQEGDFEFSFKSSADLVVSDGAKIEIMFNDRSLGSLGEGRRRKLRFQANPSSQDFPY